MRCPACGATTSEGAQRCGGCGASLSTASASGVHLSKGDTGVDRSVTSVHTSSTQVTRVDDHSYHENTTVNVGSVGAIHLGGTQAATPARPCPICGRNLHAEAHFRCPRCGRDVCEFHRASDGQVCRTCTDAARAPRRKTKLVVLIAATVGLAATAVLFVTLREHAPATVQRNPDASAMAAGPPSTTGGPVPPLAPAKRETSVIKPSVEGEMAVPVPGETPAGGGRATDVGSYVVGRTLASDAGAAYSVAFAPGGQWLASGHQTGVVRVWDPVTGGEAFTLAGQVGAVWSLAFSPDGRHLAARSGDQTVRLWDLDRREETRRLVGHQDAVWAVAYSPDGRLLATASADSTVRLWNAASGEIRETLSGHTDWVTSVAFSADGLTVVSGSRDRTVRLWDVARATDRVTLEGPGGPVWSVALSRNGRLLAAGADDGTVVVWEAKTGRSVTSFVAHNGAVWALAFSPDGQSLASAGSDALVRLWATDSWREAATLSGHKEWVRGLAFGPDGAWLASAGGDGTVRLWHRPSPGR